ncbi:MAG TPA: mismatch-specific DNA-glycosylase [Nitrospira sp.]|nr:mismatch-specific DNA-glycosylase [Nitrospira sp.]
MSPLRHRTTRELPDYVKPGLRVLFVGINPGLRSAAVGHHFAGHSNRFWKLLFQSGLVPEPLRPEQDWRLPEWDLGLTNIVRRSTAGIDALSPQDYASGRRRLLNVITRNRPRLVALLGVTIYRALLPGDAHRQIRLGLQRTRLAGSPIFLLPNPSGRNAHYSYRRMLAAFRRLRRVAGGNRLAIPVYSGRILA